MIKVTDNIVIFLIIVCISVLLLVNCKKDIIVAEEKLCGIENSQLIAVRTNFQRTRDTQMVEVGQDAKYYEYDKEERIIEISDSNGNYRTVYSYETGYQVNADYYYRNALMHRLIFNFDSLDNLVSVTPESNTGPGLNQRVHYYYDSQGQIASVVYYSDVWLQPPPGRRDSMVYTWVNGSIIQANTYSLPANKLSDVSHYYYRDDQPGYSTYFRHSSEVALMGKPFKKLPGKMIKEVVRDSLKYFVIIVADGFERDVSNKLITQTTTALSSYLGGVWLDTTRTRYMYSYRCK